jgi:bacterioferritin-associated ferredoxin
MNELASINGSAATCGKCRREQGYDALIRRAKVAADFEDGGKLRANVAA